MTGRLEQVGCYAYSKRSRYAYITTNREVILMRLHKDKTTTPRKPFTRQQGHLPSDPGLLFSSPVALPSTDQTAPPSSPLANRSQRINHSSSSANELEYSSPHLPTMPRGNARGMNVNQSTPLTHTESSVPDGPTPSAFSEGDNPEFELGDPEFLTIPLTPEVDSKPSQLYCSSICSQRLTMRSKMSILPSSRIQHISA